MRNVAGLQEALISFVTTVATLGVAVVVIGVAVVLAYAVVRNSMKP